MWGALRACEPHNGAPMNKPLKAKHLTQAADELRVVAAALAWYRQAKLMHHGDRDLPSFTGIVHEEIRLKAALYDACATLQRSAAL